MANSVDPDRTSPIGAVCSGSTLFASILDLSVMLGNYLQQTTFLDVFFMPPKELWEAYSNRTVRQSVRPSVGPSVRPSCFVSGAYLLYSLK